MRRTPERNSARTRDIPKSLQKPGGRGPSVPPDTCASALGTASGRGGAKSLFYRPFSFRRGPLLRVWARLKQGWGFDGRAAATKTGVRLGRARLNGVGAR